MLLYLLMPNCLVVEPDLTASKVPCIPDGDISFWTRSESVRVCDSSRGIVGFTVYLGHSSPEALVTLRLLSLVVGILAHRHVLPVVERTSREKIGHAGELAKQVRSHSKDISFRLKLSQLPLPGASTSRSFSTPHSKVSHCFSIPNSWIVPENDHPRAGSVVRLSGDNDEPRMIFHSSCPRDR